MVNVHNSAGLVVIEVEDEGVDAVGGVEVADVVQLEPAACLRWFYPTFLSSSLMRMLIENVLGGNCGILHPGYFKIKTL